MHTDFSLHSEAPDDLLTHVRMLPCSGGNSNKALGSKGDETGKPPCAQVMIGVFVIKRDCTSQNTALRRIALAEHAVSVNDVL